MEYVNIFSKSQIDKILLYPRYRMYMKSLSLKINAIRGKKPFKVSLLRDFPGGAVS